MKKAFVSDDIVDSELLKEKRKIYILSIDNSSKKIFFLLLQYKVKVSGFAVRKKSSKTELYGLRILSTEEIEKNDSIYITSKDEKDTFRDIIDDGKIYFIEEERFEENEFTFEENGKVRKCNAALMVQMILSRVPKRQTVFLVKSEQYDFWKNLTLVLQEKIQDITFISIDEESERIYDLMYCDLDKLVIFICIFEAEGVTQILSELGLKATYHYVYIHNSFSGHVTDKYYGFDWYLGNSFLTETELPGFYIHGDVKSSQKKLVLLGNSATDPLFYPQTSWPEMLWERCKENQVVICNGAITDYSSTNEVIKLLRDVLLLKPDIVISYSGIIDFREYVPGYPYLNLNLMRTSKKWESDSGKEVIYGIKDNRSAYERWIENEKIMYSLCRMNDILFVGILQPWIGSERKQAGEKLQIWNDNYWSIAFPQFDKFVSNAKEFKEKIRIDVEKYEWLHDFTDIFSEIDDADIYYDSIHVNELGNAVVAEKIGELLDFR